MLIHLWLPTLDGLTNERHRNLADVDPNSMQAMHCPSKCIAMEVVVSVPGRRRWFGLCRIRRNAPLGSKSACKVRTPIHLIGRQSVAGS